MATTTDAERPKIHTSDRQAVSQRRFDPALAPPAPESGQEPGKQRHILAMFCYEDPGSAVGRFVLKTAEALAKRQAQVHIFSRRAFGPSSPAIRVHLVGPCTEADLIGSVHAFTHQATNAFLQQFEQSTGNVTLMAHEWSTIPTVSLLHGIKNVGSILSLHSTERQRGNLDTGASKWIEETELAGIREAQSIIVHDDGTADVVGNCVPTCRQNIINVGGGIPMAGFQYDADPGDVKARFAVGPVDPTILYVGNLQERYGVNLLMKALPAVLKHEGQARCIFVGDGDLLWPLRVYSRYLLLDHAVRMVGHLADEALYELIHSVDMVVVPSLEATPWWPVEAAWVAERPIIATAEAAPDLLEHEKNALLVEPNEMELANGIQRVLDDPALGQQLARQGKAALEDRYSEKHVVSQIQRAIGMEQAV